MYLLNCCILQGRRRGNGPSVPQPFQLFLRHPIRMGCRRHRVMAATRGRSDFMQTSKHHPSTWLGSTGVLWGQDGTSRPGIAGTAIFHTTWKGAETRGQMGCWSNPFSRCLSVSMWPRAAVQNHALWDHPAQLQPPWGVEVATWAQRGRSRLQGAQRACLSPRQPLLPSPAGVKLLQQTLFISLLGMQPEEFAFQSCELFNL